MQFFMLFWLLVSVSLNTQAAQAELTGTGKIVAQPDYVSLNIQVTSKCYPTPEQARQANDKVSQKVVGFLNRYQKPNSYYDSVVTNGGYTQPYQINQRNKIICENSFQKTNQITLRTSDIASFESLFNNIQKMVYSEFSIEPMGINETALTYVTINMPSAQISQEKEASLEQDALKNALADAKNKLTALLNGKVPNNLQLTSISEFQPKSTAPIMGARMMVAESKSAPVQFDQQWIVKTFYFTFEFDNLSVE